MMLTRIVVKNSYRFTDGYFLLLRILINGIKRNLKYPLTYYRNDNMITSERVIIKMIITKQITNGGKYYEENINRSGYAEGFY